MPALESVSFMRGLPVLDELFLTATGLANMDDFASLSTISRSLGISANPNLAHLDGLGSLLQVRDASIRSNPALTSIDGLSGLETLTALDVSANDALETLPEFPALAELDTVTISGNSNLLSGPSFPLLESTTLSRRAPVRAPDTCPSADGRASASVSHGGGVWAPEVARRDGASPGTASARRPRAQLHVTSERETPCTKP